MSLMWSFSMVWRVRVKGKMCPSSFNTWNEGPYKCMYIANIDTNDLRTDVKPFTFTGQTNKTTDEELMKDDINDYDDNNEDVRINILNDLIQNNYIQASINSCEDNVATYNLLDGVHEIYDINCEDSVMQHIKW